MTHNVYYRMFFPDVFPKKCVLKYLAKLTGKHVYKSLFQKRLQTVGLQL